MIRLAELGYLTTSEAADFLGVSRQTIYNLKAKDLLPEPFLIQDGMVIWKKSDMKKVKKTLNIK